MNRLAPRSRDVHQGDKNTLVEDESKVMFSTRLTHLTFAQFTLPMSTGGLALLLYSTPHQFTGLQTIGKVVFIFDLVFFLLLCIAISYRFYIKPGSLRLSLTHPTESLFFPTFLLAFVNILNCSNVYGIPACGPWLVVALRVLFWFYVAISFLAAAIQYWILFTAGKRLTIHSMTPAWILPAFSAMLVGALAAVTSAHQPPESRMPILIAGVTFQGFGWCVSLLMFGLFISRLMQYGLPAPNLRPGMFIAVGPGAFTALALIQMSNNIPEDYGYFATQPMAASILQVLALFSGIFLWTLAFWFFCIAAISVIAGLRKMSFHLVWWAMVFPNVGFTIATVDIGKALDSPGVLWVSTAMTIMIVCLWITVFVCQIIAISRKEIMMPGKDEDKGMFRVPR